MVELWVTNRVKHKIDQQITFENNNITKTQKNLICNNVNNDTLWKSFFSFHNLKWLLMGTVTFRHNPPMPSPPMPSLPVSCLSVPSACPVPAHARAQSVLSSRPCPCPVHSQFPPMPVPSPCQVPVRARAQSVPSSRPCSCPIRAQPARHRLTD
jgi:hypothetical protein